MAHWKYFLIIRTIYKSLWNKTLSVSIIVVLRQNFLNTFIKIAILGKLCQCSSCYVKLEQHWIECIWVLSNPIIQCLVHKKVSALNLSALSQNFLIVTCSTFGRFQIRTLRPNGFKNQANDRLNIEATWSQLQPSARAF